ncbi:MAG: hypothetical protein R3D85_15265 [Paracoccaceae bacterium]
MDIEAIEHARDADRLLAEPALGVVEANLGAKVHIVPQQRAIVAQGWGALLAIAKQRAIGIVDIPGLAGELAFIDPAVVGLAEAEPIDQGSASRTSAQIESLAFWPFWSKVRNIPVRKLVARQAVGIQQVGKILSEIGVDAVDFPDPLQFRK